MKDYEKFFEQCFKDGDTEITLQGIPKYLKDAYKEYYAKRINNGEKEKQTFSNADTRKQRA